MNSKIADKTVYLNRLSDGCLHLSGWRYGLAMLEWISGWWFCKSSSLQNVTLCAVEWICTLHLKWPKETMN